MRPLMKDPMEPRPRKGWGWLPATLVWIGLTVAAIFVLLPIIPNEDMVAAISFVVGGIGAWYLSERKHAQQREEAARAEQTRQDHAQAFIESAERQGSRRSSATLPLDRWQVVSAYGWDLPKGALVTVSVFEQDLTFALSDLSRTPIRLPWNELHVLEVGGPGLQVSDAGIIGGGFGVWGAIQGIALASVVNAATTRQTVDTLLQIRGVGGGVLLHTSEHLPNEVESALDLALGALAAKTHTPAHSVDVVDQLERLADMQEQGLISPEEWEAAKKKLLGF